MKFSSEKFQAMAADGKVAQRKSLPNTELPSLLNVAVSMYLSSKT